MAEAEEAPVKVQADETSEAAQTEATPEAPAADVKGEDEEQRFEVREDLLDWLVGPGAESILELERLSGARIEVSQEAPVNSQRALKLTGKAISVSRARVLLEDKLRNAPGQKDDSSSVSIAGRLFRDRDGLVSHIRALQAATSDGTMLGPEDAFFIFHLATFHPNFADKMTAPVVGFKYGPHESFPGSKCFFVVRADGSEEGISIMKCVDAVLPKGKGPGRGVKRGREEETEQATEGAAASKESTDEPAASKPKREMQVGCVLIIEGVPVDFSYEDLKDILGEYGHCRFVEIMRDTPATIIAETKEAETKAEGESKPEDQQEPKAESKPETESKTEEAKKDDEDATIAEVVAKADEEAEDEEADDDTPSLVIARARFADAESATKAAQELKEVDGHPVTCRVLQGDEEREFWDRLWQKADARQDKGGKGKGKGKGKDGKGKGKGKSKGKGKGKKGKSK